jgi:hypothetical protein
MVFMVRQLNDHVITSGIQLHSICNWFLVTFDGSANAAAKAADSLTCYACARVFPFGCSLETDLIWDSTYHQFRTTVWPVT